MRHLLTDLRGLSESPARTSGPAQTETVAQIQSALHREARRRSKQANDRADWLDLWRTRLFSQSIGAMVSFSLFFLVSMGIFRPVYEALSLAQVATHFIFEYSRAEEIQLRVMVLKPPPPPTFYPNDELLNIGASLSNEGEVTATVKVHRDGRASINQIEGTANDHSAMTKISTVITRQASFQPTRRDVNTSSEAVVIFSKINISG